MSVVGLFDIESLMSKENIKKIIERLVQTDGVFETGIRGVHIFRLSEPIVSSPSVYKPSVAAILSGSKEFFFDGHRHTYDNSKYLCCSVTMPLQAGTSNASPENPLLGVYISLDSHLMSELAIKIDNTNGIKRTPKGEPESQGIALSSWDEPFTEALLRLLQLIDDPVALTTLGVGRLMEVYFAILQGEAGISARQAFGSGNAIARTIDYMSSNLDKSLVINDIASRVGMSKTVFHRKFKEATSMSPIQFSKLIRLNNAAMKIAGGASVNRAAEEVGYVSSSQFSREFKRQYGKSPKQWGESVNSRLESMLQS